MKPEFGRHDKIELALEGHVNFTREEDLQKILAARVAHSCSRPKVFNAARGGAKRTVQPVAKDRWLFSGGLEYLVSQPGRRSVRLELGINPTRFAAYTARFQVKSVAELASIPSSELLTRDPTVKARLEAAALSKWDNYLPAYDPWIAAATDDWYELVRIYLNAVVQLIQSDFNERSSAECPSDPPLLRLQHPLEYVPQLRYAEVNWEFAVDDARLAYGGVERGLRAAAESFDATDQRQIREGREELARWIKVRLREGVKLTAYTKLPQRIRFEISYKGSSRSIGQLVRPEFAAGSDLIQRLEVLRVDGARRLETVLVGLPSFAKRAAAGEIAQLSTALAEIAKWAKGDSARVRDVVSQLVVDGALSVRPRSMEASLARRLETLGLIEAATLVQRAARRRYVLRDGLADTFARFRASLLSPDTPNTGDGSSSASGPF